ncbi:MAG: PAS domain-containing sensor histidine kinase [Anaerolineae bacterium]|nr:PAS domain-containing sensor histidine kinase [Anaerolineae bacterium]
MLDDIQARKGSAEIETLARLIADQERELATLRALVSDHERSNAELKDLLERMIQVSTPTHDAHETTLATTPQALLAETAYDGLLLVDHDQIVRHVNETSRQLFGREPHADETLQQYTGLAELEAMIMDALAYGEDSFEEQISIDGRAFRTRVRVLRLDQTTWVALVFQDVTELVRLRRARRDMVANISHELRNPIANIRLIIDSLFHEQEKPKRKASTSALKAIARETDSLLWLVQELYDLSMIESGEAILRMVETPLAPLVSEGIERMEDQSDYKNLRLESEVSEELMVLADRDQVRRVLMNLIHNAIKFSPENGRIVIGAEANSIDVTISVIDEGPGVPEEHVQRIFERFYQVDQARSRGEGTGLGLAICKHIVEAHDGRIWAESNEMGGGRFFFTLPLAQG